MRTTSCLRYVTAHRPLTTAPPRLIMTSKAQAADTARSGRWSPHHRRQVRQDSVALRQLSGSSDVSLSLPSGHLPRSQQGSSLSPTAIATVMVRTSTFLDRSGHSPLGMRSLHAAGIHGPAFRGLLWFRRLQDSRGEGSGTIVLTILLSAPPQL